MIRYPGGIPKKSLKKTKKINTLKINSYQNRGMSFEAEINQSNQFYAANKRAIITKRPTPINVVKVDYQRGAKITHAYFETQSTTDYNGIYRGKYLDFEAKSTQSKTALPIANITQHQREHLAHIIEQGGLACLLISFASKDEVYVLKAEDFLRFCEQEKRQSLPYAWIQRHGAIVPIQYQPRLDYLSAIDQLYFSKKK
jgi:recombination protein U